MIYPTISVIATPKLLRQLFKRGSRRGGPAVEEKTERVKLKEPLEKKG
jgi:hypothetical protein